MLTESSLAIVAPFPSREDVISSAPMSLARLERDVETWMGLLDPALTTEYHRALEVIPEIVRKESRIEDFLRITKNNPQQAATRLAKYWKTRKEIFGERWLLPMTQSGSGALSQEDINILRSGFCKVVRSATHGTVYINDFSLLPKGSTQMQTKIAFLEA